jgi:hypothetical protein
MATLDEWDPQKKQEEIQVQGEIQVQEAKPDRPIGHWESSGTDTLVAFGRR